MGYRLSEEALFSENLEGNTVFIFAGFCFSGRVSLTRSLLFDASLPNIFAIVPTSSRLRKTIVYSEAAN